MLSAVIFNALIIMALIPQARRGVKYRPLGASDQHSRPVLKFNCGRPAPP
jgi:K+-transporting ATPase ATPase B chain